MKHKEMVKHFCVGETVYFICFIRNDLDIYKGIANRTEIYKGEMLLLGMFQFYPDNNIPLFILNILYMAGFQSHL